MKVITLLFATLTLLGKLCAAEVDIPPNRGVLIIEMTPPKIGLPVFLPHCKSTLKSRSPLIEGGGGVSLFNVTRQFPYQAEAVGAELATAYGFQLILDKCWLEGETLNLILRVENSSPQLDLWSAKSVDIEKIIERKITSKRLVKLRLNKSNVINVSLQAPSYTSEKSINLKLTLDWKKNLHP